MSISTDWTAPAAYLRGLVPIPKWRLAAAQLCDAFDHYRIAARQQRAARKLRRLQSPAAHLPNYLREDIGLPPIRSDRFCDLSQYR
ncbi:MAG: hypothetical protein ABIQ30_00745 [Devosia sp.]